MKNSQKKQRSVHLDLGPAESVGAAGQVVQRRELLRRGLGLGLGVLFVGSSAAAAQVGGGGVGQRKSLCGLYDPDGNMTVDTLCGTVPNGLETVEDASCGQPTTKGDSSGYVTQDYDCSTGGSDSSCAKPAGSGSFGTTSYWADLNCGLQEGQDLDCGMLNWKGGEFRDNSQA